MQRQADWLARRAERETKRAARALSPKASKRRCFPWRTMEIGDSFLANTPHIRTSAHAMGKYYGKKFSVRKTPEGLRVWRIA
ncbi:MAG TPA: hypothetical protein VJ396_09410 [Acidiferrobacterales bacterium]|nr:hypothetical protein [Acidiferrobacterales bacterium]